MKKISSAILLTAFLVFINCKNNATEAADSKNDSANAFYQSLIKLGNGFMDVFTSFGGLVGDVFGLKGDAKKSHVKEYFSSIAKTLEDTKKNLDNLPKEESSEKAAEKKDSTGVDGAIGKLGALLDSMLKGVQEIVKGTDGEEEIGKVLKAAADKSTGAEGESVKGIAQGIKGIVDAAKSGGVELKDKEEGGNSNVDAGKLFLVKNANANANGGSAADAEKAAAAVSKVSGEAILSAIVKDAESATATGKKAGEARNPIEAAIGENADGNEAAFGGSMNKDAQIAAAITLRGMAKGGKFALKNNANSEKALKSTVESAVGKTLGALGSLIRKSVEEGLKKVAEEVKNTSNGVGTTEPAAAAKK